MSMRYKGGVISATPPTTSSSSAPGIWTLEQQLQAVAAGNWPSPPVSWIATLGTGVEGYSSATDTAGNVHVVGYDNGIEAFITKYNALGTIQWQRNLGQASYNDFGLSVAVDSSSNVYLAGTTFSTVGSTNDVLIAKYNSSGSLQWQRRLRQDTGDDQGYGIAVDSSSNVYVVGRNATTVGVQLFVAKYNTSGTLQWQRKLGASDGSQNIGYAVAVDSSANIYAIGATGTVTAGSFDALLAKYNSSGTIQWQRSFGGVNPDYGYGVAVDSSSNVYITGSTSNTTAYIAKYNSSGTLQWQRTLTGTGDEEGFAIAIDSASNAYLTGYTTTNGAGVKDVLIAKYDSSGAIQWQRVLGTSKDDIGQGIAIGPSNSVCLGGRNKNASNLNQVLISKLPGDGSKTGTYGSFTYAASTLTDSAGSYTSATTTLTDAVAGFTDETSTLTDAATSFTSTVTTI